MSRSQMPDHAKSQQKASRRHRCQSNQPHIDHAMDFLPAAAVFAFREVAFVVAAHLWREAGDVVPPARQNLSNDWINALLTHGGKPKMQSRKTKHASPMASLTIESV